MGGLFLLLALHGCGPAAPTEKPNMDTPSSVVPVDAAVVVSQTSFDSTDVYAVVYSNITFVNALRGRYLTNREVAPNALRSYYVDYYLAEVNNGNFSQFVYNSHWDSTVVRYVREGLAAMGAQRHLALFERGASLIDGLGETGLQAYLNSEYAGDNTVRDQLNGIGDAFYEVSKQEDLVKRNAQWLRSLPDLRVLPIAQMQAEVESRSAALPDFAARQAAARANEPRYYKISRALCAQAAQKFVSVNSTDKEQYQGRDVQATHISTDKGHHYWFEENGRLLLVDTNGEFVVALDTATALAGQR